MKKPKILKSLPKSRTKKIEIKKKQVILPQNDKFTENYLNFYDDIKTPSKRHDW